MNVIFLSPNFPLHFYNFCDRLKRLGCNVLGIGDCPYDNLDNNVKCSLTEYYYVCSLEDYNQVMRAVAFYTFKYGKIDYVESQNEYWLPLEAKLREDFNVYNGLRPNELRTVLLKSEMKHTYQKAGIKTAHWMVLDSKSRALKFAKMVGFPLIIKPNHGVGAAQTFKIDTAEQLNKTIQLIENDGRAYIIEEFVPGHVETFDGITDSHGKIIFCTGQVMKHTPLAMLAGDGENISYTCNMQQSDLLEVGERAVAAFAAKRKFFHFEFFRLDTDKPSIGKKGEIVGLEVNMRTPGGYIPDKMNYAYDVDVYQIWAESLVYDENRSFKDYDFKRYVTHYGRGAGVDYMHTAEDIRQRFGNRILLEKIPPSSISGGMGAQVFILKADSKDMLIEDGEYILAKKM